MRDGINISPLFLLSEMAILLALEYDRSAADAIRQSHLGRSPAHERRPCFRGTRVPVQNLIDLLEGGETTDTFLSLYPTITRQQVVAVLDFAKDQIIECASSLTNA
jgi:uncharacterized protein (DUF433 family)